MPKRVKISEELEDAEEPISLTVSEGMVEPEQPPLEPQAAPEQEAEVVAVKPKKPLSEARLAALARAALKRPATAIRPAQLPEGWAIRTVARASGASKGTTDNGPAVQTLKSDESPPQRKQFRLTMGIMLPQIASHTAAWWRSRRKRLAWRSMVDL